MNYYVKFLCVVLLMTLVDICYAKYTIEITKRRALRSGLWSSAIILCGAFVTVSYIGDKTMILAAVIGAFLGTYFTVKHDK